MTEGRVDPRPFFLNATKMVIKPIVNRFLEKVNKTESCWTWTAAIRASTGYGVFKIDGITKDAHRMSYELFKGPIPSGMLVCHMCDNRKCVSPNHIFLGTYKDNYNDAVAKGRAKFHPQKHPSISAYKKRGCRCDGCRRLYAEMIYKWRQLSRTKFETDEELLDQLNQIVCKNLANKKKTPIFIDVSV